MGGWWADHWATIETTWSTSSAGVAAGPLLEQPAKTVVTVALSVMLASGTVDVAKLRDLVADWWDQPVLRRAAPPSPRAESPGPAPDSRPAGPTPPVVGGLGVKPAGGLVDDERLPPAYRERLREMARRMGGVPTWWTGGGATGEAQVPSGAKVGKLR